MPSCDCGCERLELIDGLDIEHEARAIAQRPLLFPRTNDAGGDDLEQALELGSCRFRCARQSGKTTSRRFHSTVPFTLTGSLMEPGLN